MASASRKVGNGPQPKDNCSQYQKYADGIGQHRPQEASRQSHKNRAAYSQHAFLSVMRNHSAPV